MTGVTYDIQYKNGDIDLIGAALFQDGNVIDLTDCTVDFVMKDFTTGLNKHTIHCTLGGTVNEVYFSPARGGVTAQFTTDETGTSGELKAEFVLHKANGDVVHIPSGNNYLYIMIWDSV